jgi:hypothetical protein
MTFRPAVFDRHILPAVQIAVDFRCSRSVKSLCRKSDCKRGFPDRLGKAALVHKGRLPGPQPAPARGTLARTAALRPLVSVPPFLKLPISSSFFVSTEMTGCLLSLRRNDFRVDVFELGIAVGMFRAFIRLRRLSDARVLNVGAGIKAIARFVPQSSKATEVDADQLTVALHHLARD